MNQRAIDLGVIWRSQLAAIGPAARALDVSLFLQSWAVCRIEMATDAALRALAVDFGLEQARTERRGRLWWRAVSSRADGLIVVGVGPGHHCPPPEEP